MQATSQYGDEHRGEHLRRVDFDPVARVAGPLSFRTMVDLERGGVLEASALATLYRGYEDLLPGRDARDAIFISSRACGACGGAHPLASALACEMAFGAAPPPAGIVARNVLGAIENLLDHPIHLFMRAGPDYSEPTVRRTNPELWARAEQTAAPGFETHGYRRISDIMTGMTAFSGDSYRRALELGRVGREAYSFVGGKYPHPQTITPAGISSTIDPSDMNMQWLRVVKFLDYGRRVVALWDDLIEFFYEADPRTRGVGAGPKNFLDVGMWDDPWSYDGTYDNAPAWGEQRWSTPGVVVDGRLRTTSLHEIDSGIEEYVAHSFYEDWSGDGAAYPTGPVGNRLSARHPWNKWTLPQPGAIELNGPYSWATAARWDRLPMETGASARLWVTALARRVPHNRFLESTGHSLRMNVPQASLPEGVVEWHVPESWNALERNRARAYSLLHSALVAYENLLIGYDIARMGGPDAHVFTKYSIPKEHVAGVGFWGSARGAVTHHLTIEDRVIRNYQIIGPGTFTLSPTDPFGNAGPVEEAVMATPLLSTREPERCMDVLRAIRSFDPCANCASH